jgi:glyoxylase-like metal-dependent hydrolase (beta-lactamase superfamily II)
MTLRIYLFAALVTMSLAACGGATDAVAPTDPAPAATPESAPLSFDVFTAGAAGFHATSTLIRGERDAVLVDAQFNLSSARELATWIAERDVNLTAIVVTHAHPDHYFGAEAILDVFPGTPIYATADVVAHMRELGPAKLAYWGPIYGDDLTTEPIVATVLEDGSLDLEGRVIELVSVHADVHPMNIVHVPSLDLVVAADLAYSDVHVWLADVTTADARARWLSSIEDVEALEPTVVVPGHRGPNGTSAPTVLADTRQYIAAFDRLRGETNAPAELQAAMTELYPDLALPVILELASGAAF